MIKPMTAEMYERREQLIQNALPIIQGLLSSGDYRRDRYLNQSQFVNELVSDALDVVQELKRLAEAEIGQNEIASNLR
jgi:hypothetical protein